MIDTDNVQVAINNGVMRIQLNRPERKNALSLAMYGKLDESFREANQDADVRVVLITGAEGSFTSGNDLDDFAKAQGTAASDNPVFRFMDALLYCDKPVVAAVQGPAVGIGTTMLLHCDLVYAGASAYFQLPFARLGLCPEFASSLLLPRMMGHQKAAELLYFSEPLSGEAAREVGIVNELFSDEELSPAVEERCRQLVRQPASGLRATKRLLRKEIREQAGTVMDEEQKQFLRGLQSPEFREAVTAFSEKRSPDFSSFS